MFNYTYHSHIDATQYVHADVSSGVAVERTLYYTHHIETGAPQYVHVDASSDVAVE
jgi:hypothetical protein